MNLALVVSVAAVGFGAVTALAIALGYGRFRGRLMRLPGELRSRVLLGLLAAPVLVGIVLSGLALLPGLVALVWPALDHCTHHDDAHFHLCLVHAPTIVATGVSWAALATAIGVVSIGMARTGGRLLRGGRLLLRLRRGARLAPQGDHAIVEADAAFAVTVGLYRPRVFVTAGLMRDLDPRSQRVVLAHEAAHVARRDPLRKLLGELAGSLHLPWMRKRLLDDLALACEEACDERAAAVVGDRTSVAAALVRVSRLVMRGPTPMAARFGDASIDVRVHALLDPPKEAPAWPRPRSIAIVGGLLVGALVGPIHHLTETLLGTLLG